ncbi:allene oxide cyclase barrel-like domain-containing protein [Streptomyces sp. SudanB25_2051]|uniref:allene oxide cyclase barrel-like domain-containing protein n=1 Tax=Streptomyces sp. SudanB25_2051 TaxID=3035275 RepID=UPI003F5456D4
MESTVRSIQMVTSGTESPVTGRGEGKRPRGRARLMRFGAGALAAVAVGVWAVGSANAGPAKGRVEILELKVQNDQYTAADLGPAGPSLGDMDVYSGTAVKDGRSVGRGGGSCQVVHMKGDEVTSQCVITMEVAEGSVTMQSLWTKGAPTLDMAVTGGTGAYRNARGIARFWDIATPNERARLEITR